MPLIVLDSVSYRYPDASEDALRGASLSIEKGEYIAVIGFYCANEAFSIIENAALMGVPFPRGILRALERFRDVMDEKEGD